MKNRIWLKQNHPRGTWTHSLARLSNGMVVVAEAFHGGRFSPVGCATGVEFANNDDMNDTIPLRLFKGERDLIVRSLFKACLKELGTEKAKKIIKQMEKN